MLSTQLAVIPTTQSGVQNQEIVLVTFTLGLAASVKDGPFLIRSFQAILGLTVLTLTDAKTGNVLVELVIKEAGKPCLWGEASQNLVPGAPELGLSRDVFP